MGNTISIARKGLWGFHEEPRIKRRCVRRNPPPSTGTSTGGGNGSGGGTGSGSGSGTSTGGGGSNGGGSGSGSGSGSSGGSGSGSGSGSGRGGDSRSGTSQSGGGSSREHGDEGNTGGKGGTGSETSHDKGSGDNGGNGDDEGGGRHNGLESLGGSGTSPSQASSKKFFQAVAGSTGGANPTDPSNTATPTDEYGSPLPNPTSLPRGSDSSDSSDSSDATVVGGGRPSTGVIIAIIGGVLAGLAVLLVLAWLGHRAWKRREEKRLMTTEKSAIPPRFSSESFPAPPPLPTPGTAVHNTSTLISREKGLTKPPTHPFTSIHEADSSTAVHEMPSRMPETIGNRHELATPDILEIPDFGDIDLDITDHEDDGDDLGIRRPTSLL